MTESQKDTGTPVFIVTLYAQQPGHGNKLNAHRWRAGRGRRCTHIQCDITQPQKIERKK